MSIDEIQADFVANFNATPRLHWTPSLHERFVNVVNELGGPLEAKPKAIRDMMGVQQLTIRHIKSHLQKYRASPQDVGIRSGTYVSNDNQLKSDDSAPLPRMTFPNDIGGNGNFDVSKLQIGIEGIPYLVPASYDNGGQGVYDVSEEIPYVVPAADVIRSHEVHDASVYQQRTEEIPHSYASYAIGNHEDYHPQGVQIQEPEQRYTHKNTDAGSKKDTGKKLEASACTMQYSDDFLAFLNWDTTSSANWGNEVYNEPTSILETEEVARTALQEYQNYIASLDSGSNNKGKGTMEVHPQGGVVTYHPGFSTDNMPSGHTLSTPYGMGGHGIYDASNSSVQRGLEDGVRQGSTVEKHDMIREDADNRYTTMDQAFMADSDWLNLMTSHPGFK